MTPLNAHQRPPEEIKAVYKIYQKLTSDSLDRDPDILDFSRGLHHGQQDKLRVVRLIDRKPLIASCSFVGGFDIEIAAKAPVFEHKELPGFHIVPSLVPKSVQWHLLSLLLHRDLANEQHQTNVDMHYYVSRPAALKGSNGGSSHTIASKKADLGPRVTSFFKDSPDAPDLLLPKDPRTHKPITIAQFLERKLRWMTLGGQYDWTKKIYPTGNHPPFPEDVAGLVHNMFPEMRPEAAIVNVYSPGDTLSLHRDVSEHTDDGLVSISFGCDGVFIVGIENDIGEPKHLAMRLRSGDAVYMSGPTRYAWHGVSQVVAGTCPAWLSEWPASSKVEDLGRRDNLENYEAWRDWMANKRVNLNVRQMTA